MFKCQNGVDYDECDKTVLHEGSLCEECDSIETERAYDAFLEHYYGGSACVTLKEKQDASFKELRALGIK